MFIQKRVGSPVRLPFVKRRTRSNRAGAAIVELAVFAPVLVAFCFGSLELTFYIFLKQSLATAAYEGVRNAASREGTLTTATEEAERIFEERRIDNGSVQFTPSPDVATAGQMITVTITAPMSDNAFFRTGLFSPQNVSVSATMVRE